MQYAVHRSCAAFEHCSSSRCVWLHRADANVEECNYDGGDCCEYSCMAGAIFSCGSHGYECFDPDAPEYDAVWPRVDLGSLIALGIATAVGCLWCYFFCCIYFSDRHTGLLDKKRRATTGRRGSSEAEAGSASISASGPQEPKASLFAVAFAWFLLAVELGVTSYLFLVGQGRVSKKVVEYNNDEYPLLGEEMCVEGEGAQLVSFASFYRDGVAVVSQLILWTQGGGTELPERAFLKMLVACFSSCCIADRPWSRAITWQTSFQGSWWGQFLMFVVSGHMLWPLLVDVQAVCAIAYDVQILFFVLLGIVLLCCNCSCACIGRGQGGLIHVVDAVFNGVLGTWANYIQSGLYFGVAFAVLPTFEVAYSVAELFSCTSSYSAELPL